MSSVRRFSRLRGTFAADPITRVTPVRLRDPPPDASMLTSLLAGTVAVMFAAGAGGHPIATTKSHAMTAARSTAASHAVHTTRSAVASASSALVADSIVVVKRAHTLTLFRAGQAVKTYRVALGRVQLPRRADPA